MRLEQGTIVWAADPFEDDSGGRPWLVIGNGSTPFHGEQFPSLALTSKSYHDEALSLRESDHEGVPLSVQSHLVPWSVATVERDGIERYVTAVGRQPLEDAIDRLSGYLAVDD